MSTIFNWKVIYNEQNLRYYQNLETVGFERLEENVKTRQP